MKLGKNVNRKTCKLLKAKDTLLLKEIKRRREREGLFMKAKGTLTIYLKGLKSVETIECYRSFHAGTAKDLFLKHPLKNC